MTQFRHASALFEWQIDSISNPEPSSFLLRMLDENEGPSFSSSMRSKKLEGSGYEIEIDYIRNYLALYQSVNGRMDG